MEEVAAVFPSVHGHTRHNPAFPYAALLLGEDGLGQEFALGLGQPDRPLVEKILVAALALERFPAE